MAALGVVGRMARTPGGSRGHAVRMPEEGRRSLPMSATGGAARFTDGWAAWHEAAVAHHVAVS
jgi:hypothetical protein